MKLQIKKNIQLSNSDGIVRGKSGISLNASKSESNRALLIKALSHEQIQLENLASARDTQTMDRLLKAQKESSWDVLDAGTTMRFLTAFLALRAGTYKTITGSARMQQRPIKLLVDALRKLGSDVSYLQEDGFPPLKIRKLQKQLTNQISIPGNVSSQYISALLMIAPVLPNGLKLSLEGEIFSKPYIDMTLSLMEYFGVPATWHVNTIIVDRADYKENRYRIESDWSGASYWYSMMAIAQDGQIRLQGLRKDSFQGDQKIAEIMDKLGVASTYEPGGVLLQKKKPVANLELDFKGCPDLAQTVMVAAAANRINLTMTGLESLRIKETDRIAAMQTELAKIQVKLDENASQWHLDSSKMKLAENTVFQTYEDHRMAMAFAPLALLTPIAIEDPEVVNKSYPDFWNHMQEAGFTVRSA